MKKLIISLLLILILASIGSGCVVKSPSINSFDASPISIAPGANSVISWNVVGAESVSIDQGIGNVALTGSRIVSPATTTVYTLTATSSGVSSKATTEVVVSATAAAAPVTPTPAPTPEPTPTPTPMALPIINYFNASPSLVSSGDTATLSWGVTDATTVTIDPGLGSVGLVGTAPVSPADTTEYTLTATNAAGWQSVTITILVGPAPSPAPAPDLIITDIIRSGSTISYVIKNDGTATASPSTSQLTVDGVVKATDAVGPLSAGASSTESFSYSYTCSGASDSLAVQADKSDVVDESNEGNNARSESTMCVVIGTIQPGGVILLLKPDLIITDIWRDGSKIRYRIKNQGVADAGPSKTRLIVDGMIKGIDGVEALPAGAEAPQVFAGYTLPFIPFHTFSIKVIADYTNEVAETDDSNNTRNESIP